MPPAGSGSRKRSLLEASNDAAKAAPKQKPKKGHGVSEQVAKAIRDNFKDFSQAEIDSNLVDGKTLRQRLTADKELNSSQKGSVTTGRYYYTRLRDLYSSKDSNPEKLLTAGPDPGEVSDQLWTAMVATKKMPINRVPIMSFLETSTKEPNKAELVGILRFCLQCQASISAEQQRCIILTMMYLVRFGLHKKYPDEMQIMKPKFNDGLTKVMLKRAFIIVAF